MLGQKFIKPLSIDVPIDTFGLYAISITARCQSGKLLGLWGGENLRVEIDDVQFREIPPEKKNQKFDIPPAWNGTVLQGRVKTVIFLSDDFSTPHFWRDKKSVSRSDRWSNLFSLI